MGIKRDLLIGLPVMDIKSGRQLGTIQDLCLTSDSLAVEGLLVAGGGWSGKNFCIPYNNIRTIGPHAVIVETADKPDNINDNAPERYAGVLVGMQVMAADGRNLGTISDIIIDPLDGTIQSMELSEGPLDDLIKGRSILPWYPPGNSNSDAHIISGEHADQLSSYNKGIKNIFLNKL